MRLTEKGPTLFYFTCFLERHAGGGTEGGAADPTGGQEGRTQTGEIHALLIV